MNGAIADPWASTNIAPIRIMMARMGTSQNFLRARANAQSSFNSDIAFSSDARRFEGVPKGPQRAERDSTDNQYVRLRTDCSCFRPEGRAVSAKSNTTA